MEHFIRKFDSDEKQQIRKLENKSKIKIKTIKQSLHLMNNGGNRFFLPKYISY